MAPILAAAVRRKGLTEGELLEGAAKGLGEEEVDEDDLEREPAAVRDEVSPADIVETDGVDKGGEEAGQAAKELEGGDSVGALGEGPHLNHVS